MIENAFAGIVLTAQSFNPSIFTETWLANNNIISPDKLTGMRVFSPEVAQFQTDEIQVLVMPPKMQITFSIHDITENFDLPCKVAVRTVELLPHTPYQALGLNFDYFVAQPVGQNFNAYNRTLLGQGDYHLLQEFSTEDSRFGRYFSKDYEDARLRLDMKPVKAGPESKDLLKFSFNFHYDFAQIEQVERAKELIRLIGTWDTLREYAGKLVSIGSNL